LFGNSDRDAVSLKLNDDPTSSDPNRQFFLSIFLSNLEELFDIQVDFLGA
jgi:hypothetical protein